MQCPPFGIIPIGNTAFFSLFSFHFMNIISLSFVFIHFQLGNIKTHFHSIHFKFEFITEKKEEKNFKFILLQDGFDTQPYNRNLLLNFQERSVLLFLHFVLFLLHFPVSTQSFFLFSFSFGSQFV